MICKDSGNDNVIVVAVVVVAAAAPAANRDSDDESARCDEKGPKEDNWLQPENADGAIRSKVGGRMIQTSDVHEKMRRNIFPAPMIDSVMAAMSLMLSLLAFVMICNT